MQQFSSRMDGCNVRAAFSDSSARRCRGHECACVEARSRRRTFHRLDERSVDSSSIPLRTVRSMVCPIVGCLVRRTSSVVRTLRPAPPVPGSQGFGDVARRLGPSRVRSVGMGHEAIAHLRVPRATSGRSCSRPAALGSRSDPIGPVSYPKRIDRRTCDVAR
jgi:hypothetical protein